MKTLFNLKSVLRSLMLSLIFISAMAANARETDQYLTWSLELPDSAPLINDYMMKHMQSVLNDPANKQKKCQDISLKFFKKLVGTFTFSQFSLWAQNGLEMQDYRFPPKGVSKFDYVKKSIFAGNGASPIIKWIIGLAPSINVNGIYLGTDKLGHISYMGYKYYRKYLKLVKKGMGEDLALTKVIKDGLKSETMLGGFYGTTSPSDLEANYQGLQLAIDLCHGSNPILTKQASKWIVDSERFKIQNYVSPEFDESYYPLIFGRLTWNKSAKNRIQKICQQADLSIVTRRFADYRTRFIPSRNIEIMSRKMRSDRTFNNSKFNYQNVCGFEL